MNNIWENPNCNFCGYDKHKVIWKNISTWIAEGRYQIVLCENCNLVFLSPRPKKVFISKYYPPETYWGVDVINSKNKESLKRQSVAYDYIYRQIFKRKRNGLILDVGTGTGLFLLKFKKLGWKTDGVELSKKACEYAKNVYGLKLFNGSFPEVKLPIKRYDVITFNGCLEHLYQPRESLVKTYKLLKNNGIIEINVPNFNSLGRLIFNKYWYALQPPSHLYHFTSATITRILKDIGFTNIKISHSYWNQNKYILFESIRLFYSPNFTRKKIRNFVSNKNTAVSKKFSIKIEIGKILAIFVSFILALVEPIIKRGEVITIYATKH